MMLFIKELKKVVCSLPYILLIAALAIGLSSQGVFRFKNDKIEEPQPGGSYGTKSAEVPELIMPGALHDLWYDFSANEYITYPIGFIKSVRLNEDEQALIAEILSEITDIDAQTLLSNREQDGFGQSLAVCSDITYDRFKELMQQTDHLLGGGSQYAPDSLIHYASIPLSYEEAKAQYDLFVSHDQITGGYARLFSDYAGVMLLSILPVFLAVILCTKDRRSKMQDLIYTKRVPGAKLLLSRYIALIIAILLPVIFLAYLSNMPLWAHYSTLSLDYLAPLKYVIGWLLPSIMMAASVGFFFTELTGTPLAIAVQGFWWLLDLNMGFKTVQSGYALLRLSPRHNAGPNTWFRTQDYLDHFQDLLQNRLLFTGISILLLCLTILLYEAKRKGKLNGHLSIKTVFSHFNHHKI